MKGSHRWKKRTAARVAVCLALFAMIFTALCSFDIDTAYAGGGRAFSNNVAVFSNANAFVPVNNVAVVSAGFGGGGGRTVAKSRNGVFGSRSVVRSSGGGGGGRSASASIGNANFFAVAPAANVAFGGVGFAGVNNFAVPNSTVFLNANNLRFNAFGTSSAQDAFGNVFEVDGFGNTRFVGNRLGAAGFAPSAFGLSSGASVNNVIFSNRAVGVRAFSNGCR